MWLTIGTSARAAVSNSLCSPLEFSCKKGVLPSICDLVSAPNQLVGSWSFEFFENPHSDRRPSHIGRNLILPVFLAFLD